MIDYKVIIQDVYDNYKESFLIKANNQREALRKGFKRWMKINFKEGLGGNYNFKIHISEDELYSQTTRKVKAE